MPKDLETKHAEMLSALKVALDNGIPKQAKTASELAEDLSVSSYDISAKLRPLVDSGVWKRGRPGSKLPYRYWLAEDEEGE